VACEFMAIAMLTLLSATEIDVTDATGVVVWAVGDTGVSWPQPMTIVKLPASARRRGIVPFISPVLYFFVRRRVDRTTFGQLARDASGKTWSDVYAPCDWV
jgi:hypothetical protein